VLRGEAVTALYGKGGLEKEPDAVEAQVLASGQTYLAIEESDGARALRAIYPAKRRPTTSGRTASSATRCRRVRCWGR